MGRSLGEKKCNAYLDQGHFIAFFETVHIKFVTQEIYEHQLKKFINFMYKCYISDII